MHGETVKNIYRSFATTVSQHKICDFSWEIFKYFEVLFSMSAMTTQMLSSGEFCKLRYDTIPVKSASANVSFCTNNSKMPNFELWYSCLKWAIYIWNSQTSNNTSPYISLNIGIRVGLILDLLPKYANVIQSYAKF
jgi:hypothetical protein